MSERVKEAVQESQYLTPYHWSWREDSEEGRRYWGYLKRVKELIIHSGSKTHIDLGCGDGRATAFFKEGSDIEVTGCDYSQRAINMAQVITEGADLQWRTWDLKEVPFIRDAYDSASLVEVIEHLPMNELPHVLRNVNGIIRRGGVLVLTTPSILDTNVSAKHYQHFSRSSLTNLLIDAGFAIDLIEGQDRKSFWFYHLYRCVDNRYWSLKPLKKWMNVVVYPKYVDKATVEDGLRFIVCARKI